MAGSLPHASAERGDDLAGTLCEKFLGDDVREAFGIGRRPGMLGPQNARAVRGPDHAADSDLPRL